MERTCIHCGLPGGEGSRELRPYGPNGADICFECMMAKPEREDLAKKHLHRQLASSKTLILDPSEQVGPRPIKKAGDA